MSGQWFEDPAFWDDFKDAMFHARRLAGTPAEVDALVKLLGLVPPARILDLPCGIGRHSAELERRGFALTGVDLHEPYLAEARAAAPDVPGSSRSRAARPERYTRGPWRTTAASSDSSTCSGSAC